MTRLASQKNSSVVVSPRQNDGKPTPAFAMQQVLTPKEKSKRKKMSNVKEASVLKKEERGADRKKLLYSLNDLTD